MASVSISPNGTSVLLQTKAAFKAACAHVVNVFVAFGHRFGKNEGWENNMFFPPGRRLGRCLAGCMVAGYVHGSARLVSADRLGVQR